MWPMSWGSAVLTENDQVSSRHLPGWGLPFVHLLKSSEIFKGPTLPEVSDERLTEVPSLQQCDSTIGEGGIW